MLWGPIHGTSLYGVNKVIFLNIMFIHIFIKYFEDLCTSLVRHADVNNYCSERQIAHIICTYQHCLNI